MEIPKAQEKLHIKRFSNKRQHKGQNPYFYEVRNHADGYIGDILFLKMNNSWYLSSINGCFLSANELNELEDFIQKLPKNKSRYE